MFEFAVYYSTVHSNLQSMKAWDKLQNEVNQLIISEKKKGFFQVFIKFINAFKDLNNVFILLAEFEFNDIWADYSSHKNYHHISQTREPVLKEYIKNYRGVDYFSFPSEQVRNLLVLFQSQRSKKIEGLIVIISAIIGGVIGALITIFAI